MLEQISSLNYLRTFTIAAKYLSFKDAAKVLNISPTAVSHQIKTLESQLRTPLFIRQTRAISLTEAGTKLAVACDNSFKQLDHLLNELQQPKSDISISCCNSFAALWLTPRGTQVNTKFPRHILKICASDNLVDLNREKHIDIALRYGDDEQNSDETLLYSEQIAMYRSPNETLPTDSNPTLYVTEWPDNGLLKNIDWRLHVDTSQYRIKTVEQEYFVLQAIMTGQGYGLLSDVLSTTAIKQGWILQDKTQPPFPGYSYWYRLNQERKDNGVVQQFCEWLEKEFSTG